MVYTVTFNPALDYVVRLENFHPGETNRSDSDGVQFGGKGINVSIVLRNLGVESVALGFLAAAGSWILLGLLPFPVEDPVSMQYAQEFLAAPIPTLTLILLLIPLTLYVGVFYLGGRKYYFISLLILLETMAPFFLIFEGRKPQARELVVISASSTVFNIDFRQVAEAHEKSGASITLLYKHMDDGASGKSPSLVCDDTNRVTAVNTGETGAANVFMDTMIIDRELLLRFLDWYKNQSYLDLLDIIREDLEQIRVYGYAFDGYVRSITNATDYMSASMELLNPQVIKELFMGERQIHTKVQDAHPAKYGPNGSSRNAMIATGCVIKGTIENTIVFRGCTVEEGAVVRNSVLLPNTVLEEGVVLDRVICDKFSHISKGVTLTGTVERPLIVNLRETKK